MCRITLTYNEKDSVAVEKLVALLSTGLFKQEDMSADMEIDYSDQSLYEDDLAPLPEEKESYSPEELRALLISDLQEFYGVKDAV